MAEQFSNGVANTARWTAAYRARESARDERLFDDPWAAIFAGEEGMARLNQMTARQEQAGVVGVVARTRFFDDFLLQCANEDGIRQIVLLAAGYDSRAYRLSWPPGTRLFELDQPAVIAEKSALYAQYGAQPACEWHAIGADLRQPWADALISAGFAPAAPTVWLLEGLLFYLDAVAVNEVLNTVTSLSSPESQLGFDVANQAMLTSDWTRNYMATLARAGAPWKFGVDKPELLLKAKGWLATVRQGGEVSAELGRFSHRLVPDDIPGIPRLFFVTARRAS